MKFTRFLLIALIAAFSTACSDMLSSDNDSAGNTTTESELAKFNDELTSTDPTPIDLGDATGLIGFRIGPSPADTTGAIYLQARMIVLSDNSGSDHPFRTGGKDVGTVTLSLNGQTLDLNKITVKEGGVIYDSMQKPRKGSLPSAGLAWTDGATITVSVSGSADFASGSVTVTPTTGLTISNLLNGDTFNPAADLTINWSGASADGLQIVVLPAPPKPGTQPANGPGGKGKQGKGPGGKGPGKGPQGPGMNGPKPLLILDAEGTSGTYTISASQMTELSSLLKNDAIILEISQRTVSDVTFNTESMKVAFHVIDAVLLKK